MIKGKMSDISMFDDTNQNTLKDPSSIYQYNIHKSISIILKSLNQILLTLKPSRCWRLKSQCRESILPIQFSSKQGKLGYSMD